MERIRLDVENDEYRALAKMAEQELRPIPDQARHLVREALKRRGFLQRSSRSPKREDQRSDAAG